MASLRQITYRECASILRFNGFEFKHQKGSHAIWKNTNGRHISISVTHVNACVWQRLVKENNLDERIKKK